MLPGPAQLAKKKELNLYAKAWMDDAHACALAKMPDGNTSLTFLGLRECKRVGNKGAVCLCASAALLVNSSVRLCT